MNRLLLAATLSAVALLAADFQTGQAARAIIGQRTFSASLSTSSDTTLGGVGGIAYANNTLFVTDSNRVGAGPTNHRVLVFRNINGQVPPPEAEIPVTGERCPVCAGTASTVIGQPDFFKTDLGLSRTAVRLPTAVATDGRIVAIADTGNNRVLIWNSIPTTNGAPADVVLGQPDFTTVKFPIVVDNKSMRAPQGVWIQNGRLLVADTQNHRVMIWNQIPTSNNAAADVVVGQPNFTVAPDPNLKPADAKPDRLLNPVSVTSDGQRLIVADLGHNRVVVWNSIPTSNGAPADLVLGQPDFTSALFNNSTKVCAPNGIDDKGNATYPARCAATINFPRFALSDGRRLFIADGGNDRVLVYNNFPTENGAKADIVIGQPDEFSSIVSDRDDFFSPNLDRLSSRTLRAPQALAWDGANLYVTDPYARRVAVFTIADNLLDNNAVRNSASLQTFAVGGVTVAGKIKENDTASITIAGKEYKYTILKDDTITKVVVALANLINADGGDPNVIALANTSFNTVQLSSRKPGEDGNSITLTVATSTSADILLTASGATLSGGTANVAIAPGTIVAIFGNNLASQTAAADPNANEWPRELGGVQVYVDGIRAPLQFVSPTQINIQVPFEVSDAVSSSLYVRSVNGSNVVTTQALNLPIVSENPGVYAISGADPRPAIALHGSSYATGLVSVDGSIKANDTATITIEDRPYTYTVTADDTLAVVRDKLIAAINGNPEEKVIASAADAFTRIRLQAKVEGPEGNSITVTTTTNSGSSVILTATRGTLCCANREGAPITEDNPAVPGETIKIYATGLGLVTPDAARQEQRTGVRYSGPASNSPNAFVSAVAGGRTANLISAAYKVGQIGLYEVIVELSSDLPTNPFTQFTLAQNVYVSNIVTFPVVNPQPPQ
jgi:uncharacterized protein (TIGR03437 family)